MNEAQTLSYYGPSQATTVYCTQCGQAMRVAPQHLNTAVACPHCQQPVEPWRMTGADQHRAGYGPPPPPPHALHNGVPVGLSRRNRWVAGALGILLGYLGVHRFYLGSTGIGLTQLLLTVLSVGILSPIVAIWGIVEGILCFCGAIDDVDGLPLSG